MRKASTQLKQCAGGSNNYRPHAPMVDRIGSGFTTSGVVREAGTGAAQQGVRIQIWAATTLGEEREPRNHGSVLTAADGSYSLEMEQIAPNFDQPHAHLAYDDADFKTVFLRPVMPSAQCPRHIPAGRLQSGARLKSCLPETTAAL
ncbi:MAG: twin-arginine translocation pathway signal [Aliishimia sp.]